MLWLVTQSKAEQNSEELGATFIAVDNLQQMIPRLLPQAMLNPVRLRAIFMPLFSALREFDQATYNTVWNAFNAIDFTQGEGAFLEFYAQHIAPLQAENGVSSEIGWQISRMQRTLFDQLY